MYSQNESFTKESQVTDTVDPAVVSIPDIKLEPSQIKPNQKHLPNLKKEQFDFAYTNLNYDCVSKITLANNPKIPDYDTLFKIITDILNDTWKTAMSVEDVIALKNWELKPIISIIKKLQAKVGIAELVVMILLAQIVNHRLYDRYGCTSDNNFYVMFAETMGMSSSRARDYCKRGQIFLKYHKEILNGNALNSGIPLEELVSSHLSKLTLYEEAVKKFGRYEAVFEMRTLPFRRLQKKIAYTIGNFNEEQYIGDSSETIPKRPRMCYSSLELSDDQKFDINKAQVEHFLKLNLSPPEKRLIQIIAKGGNVYRIYKFSEDHRKQLDSIVRQRRIDIWNETHLILSSSSEKATYELPTDPFFIPEDLYENRNIRDMICRIKECLALVVPVRRVIALLTYKLSHEKINNHPLWESPREGVVYRSFRDFAMGELGMGEEYRDYIAVGKVLMKYYYFLDGLSDMDTEDVFFKLRYLPKALKIHKGDEYLVLARLRSLTIREFKLFSELPNFEVTFSKRLTIKQLELFEYIFKGNRETESRCPGASYDFIESFSLDDERMINSTVLEISIKNKTEKTSFDAQSSVIPKDLNNPLKERNV
jgi:hypothetical protein